MKDPLNKKEKRAVLKQFAEEFERTYEAILKSGAIEDLEPHDHRPARYALVIAGERFTPSYPAHRRALANVKRFV